MLDWIAKVISSILHDDTIYETQTLSMT